MELITNWPQAMVLFGGLICIFLIVLIEFLGI